DPLRVTVTVWPLTEDPKVPFGPDASTKPAPETSKPAGKSTRSMPSPGQDSAVKKPTVTLPMLPATSELGVTLGPASVPGLSVTPGAVPLSIGTPPRVVVVSEKVPVVPVAGGFRIPVRVIETLPGG